jgi:putative ABC transport system permease protein
MTLFGLAARNVLRNRFRAVLTALGTAVAVLTFVLLRTVISSWTSASEFAAKDRIVTRHKVTFVMSLPLHYVEHVRAMSDRIKRATFACWFGGKDPKHDKEFFQSLAVESDSFFEVYDDMALDADALGRWKADRQGAIVGDLLARKMGWQVGDKVSLASGIYPKDGDWEFRIAGIYHPRSRSGDRSTFAFHWKYLNENLPKERQNEIGWIVSRVVDPSSTAATAKAIDADFGDRDVQTQSQDERTFNASFLGSFSAVLRAIDVVSAVILLIMGLLLGNTIAMGVRERTQEYGVLRALGFRSAHVVGFIVGEAMVIGLGGGVLGLFLAYPLINQGFGRWLEENMASMFPRFQVTPTTAIGALLLALGLAAAAAVIPALAASRLRAVDALKRLV